MSLTRRQFLVGAAGAGILTATPWLWTSRKSTVHAQAVTKAFIGAEGYGAQANGWRDANAQILFVTNLNNDGAGSFRQAFQRTTGPRYIIFRVGGYIPIQPASGVQYLANEAGYGNCYVAGQSASGGGITLRGLSTATTHYNGLYVKSDHNCIRHIRIRSNAPQFNNDWGLAMWGASLSIADHVSLSWHDDDQIIFATALGTCTVQRCLSFEPAHFGMTFYEKCGSNSAHHNMIHSGLQRNPLSQNGRGPCQFSNNLLYNCGGYLGTLTESYTYQGEPPNGIIPRTDFVQNYYKWGPGSGWANASNWNDPAAAKEIWLEAGNAAGIAYISGNKALLPAGSGGYQNARTLNQGSFTLSGSALSSPTIPITLDDISTQQLADAWATALMANIGCTRPGRDLYDTYMIQSYTDYLGWSGELPYTSRQASVSIYANANGGNAWQTLSMGTPDHLEPSGMSDEFITRMGLANTTASALSTSISQARGLGEDFQNIEWNLMEKAGDISPLEGSSVGKLGKSGRVRTAGKVRL